MYTLLQDLRYGVRTLGKNLGVTIVAVITLALGIGANTAIFSGVSAFVFRPLPVPHPEQLVRPMELTEDRGLADEFSYPISLNTEIRSQCSLECLPRTWSKQQLEPKLKTM